MKKGTFKEDVEFSLSMRFLDKRHEVLLKREVHNGRENATNPTGQNKH